jgi:hypothetical protein
MAPASPLDAIHEGGQLAAGMLMARLRRDNAGYCYLARQAKTLPGGYEALVLGQQTLLEIICDHLEDAPDLIAHIASCELAG